MPEADYLTDSEAVAVFKSKGITITEMTLATWRRRKKGPAYHKIGGMIRYKADDISAYMTSTRIEPGKGEADAEGQ